MDNNTQLSAELPSLTFTLNSYLDLFKAVIELQMGHLIALGEAGDSLRETYFDHVSFTKLDLNQTVTVTRTETDNGGLNKALEDYVLNTENENGPIHQLLKLPSYDAANLALTMHDLAKYLQSILELIKQNIDELLSCAKISIEIKGLEWTADHYIFCIQRIYSVIPRTIAPILGKYYLGLLDSISHSDKHVFLNYITNIFYRLVQDYSFDYINRAKPIDEIINNINQHVTRCIDLLINPATNQVEQKLASYVRQPLDTVQQLIAVEFPSPQIITLKKDDVQVTKTIADDLVLSIDLHKFVIETIKNNNEYYYINCPDLYKKDINDINYEQAFKSSNIEFVLAHINEAMQLTEIVNKHLFLATAVLVNAKSSTEINNQIQYDTTFIQKLVHLCQWLESKPESVRASLIEESPSSEKVVYNANAHVSKMIEILLKRCNKTKDMREQFSVAFLDNLLLLPFVQKLLENLSGKITNNSWSNTDINNYIQTLLINMLNYFNSVIKQEDLPSLFSDMEYKTESETDIALSLDLVMIMLKLLKEKYADKYTKISSFSNTIRHQIFSEAIRIFDLVKENITTTVDCTDTIFNLAIKCIEENKQLFLDHAALSAERIKYQVDVTSLLTPYNIKALIDNLVRDQLRDGEYSEFSSNIISYLQSNTTDWDDSIFQLIGEYLPQALYMNYILGEADDKIDTIKIREFAEDLPEDATLLTASQRVYANIVAKPSKNFLTGENHKRQKKYQLLFFVVKVIIELPETQLLGSLPIDLAPLFAYLASEYDVQLDKASYFYDCIVQHELLYLPAFKYFSQKSEVDIVKALIDKYADSKGYYEPDTQPEIAYSKGKSMINYAKWRLNGRDAGKNISQICSAIVTGREAVSSIFRSDETTSFYKEVKDQAKRSSAKITDKSKRSPK